MSASRDPQPVGELARKLLLWRMAKRTLLRQASRDLVLRDASSRPGLGSAALAEQRVVVACLLNDAQNLPDIGRRVDRIVRRTGTVDIYFDDGSFVSASVTDPQPATSEEAAVIERVYGTPAKPKSCGCKHASCKHAQQTVDMVAAVRGNEMLRAMDVNKRGAHDPRLWRHLVEGPFDLYVLHDVPMGAARTFADLGARGTHPRSGRQVWQMARRHAEPRPFRRVRVSG